MHRFLTAPLAIALAACATVPAEAPAVSAADYADSLAARSEADRARDATRKPAQLLAFAQVAPGETVGDFIMGGGYFTRVLAAAVGPTGRVYAFTPDEFVAFRADYAKEQADTVGALANAVAVKGAAAAPAFSAPLDTIVTIQNVHDLYLGAMPAGTSTRAAAALFAALKSGGTLVIVDHSAKAGDTTAPDKLHRIDMARVVADYTAAGFRLEAESDVFADPADLRTANVFDPAIRGKTDQFALRFRKPG